MAYAKAEQSSSRIDIWMPLFIGDYLADTAHLDAERSGCYLHWLMHYWRKGPLPASIPSLIQIGRLCSEHASSIAQALLDEFFHLGPDGRYHQGRIEEELRLAGEKKLKAREKASKAANSRWGRNNQNAPRNASRNTPSNAPSIEQAMLEQCPSPSPSHEKSTPSAHAPAKGVPAELKTSPPRSTGANGEFMLATHLLQELRLAATTSDIGIVAQVIALEAPEHGGEMEACEFIRRRAVEARQRGEPVTVFWLKDRKFAQENVSGTNQRNTTSPTHERVSKNRRALVEAAERIGWENPNATADPNGGSLSKSRP
jgi:uncharacterized protein YdaU (DUF1376 family)